MNQSYLDNFLDGGNIWYLWIAVLSLAVLTIVIVLARETTQKYKKVESPSTFLPTLSSHFGLIVRGCPQCNDHLSTENGVERCANKRCGYSGVSNE